MEFGVGSIVKGKVTGITKFGAFVSLPDGRSGLVHISEIAYAYVTDVSEHLQVGQEVTVKVIGIDESNRINLSIKKALPPPPRQEGGGRRPAPRGTASRGPARSAPRWDAAPRPQSAAPTDTFEDRLKQFMQQSDSKLSEIRAADRRNTRRGNGRGR